MSNKINLAEENDKMRMLIIVPAFNEAQSIESVIADIREYVCDFDYIIINDCSTDNTAKICKEKGYNTINLPVNLGIGGCVQTGYRYAYKNNYDIAVQFDGDGQHSAEYIPYLLEKMNSENADMVIGSRFIDNCGFQSTTIRRFGITFLSRAIHIVTGRKITDPTSGFRMINKALIQSFCQHYPTDYPEPESISNILKSGYKVVETPVVMKERANGVSSIGWFNSIYYMIKVVLAIFIGNSYYKNTGKNK